MPDTPKVVAAADAMREKRRELLAQPLDRIWVQLARAALDALENAGYKIVRVVQTERRPFVIDEAE